MSPRAARLRLLSRFRPSVRERSTQAGVLLVAVADARQIAQRLPRLVGVRPRTPVMRPVYPGARLDTGLVVPPLDGLREFPRRICVTTAGSGRRRCSRHPSGGLLSEFSKDGFDRAVLDFAQKVRLFTRLGLDREPDPQASRGISGCVVIQVDLLQ